MYLKYSAPKEISIVKGKFAFFGENTEKYITSSVPIEIEVIITDKKTKEITKHISYRNPADVIHKI